MNYLSTTVLANAAGVHPNTVRLYEQWGLLPPAERKAGTAGVAQTLRQILMQAL